MNSTVINDYKIFSPLNKSELLKHVENFSGILVAMNAEKILKKNNRLRNIINHNVGYPDGIGAVWALKRRGLKTTKIAGAEFWLDIINEFQSDKSFYLIGASEDTISLTINKLKKDFKDLNIEGYRNGFLKTEEEKNSLIEDIVKKKPDVIFVAMGTPKQEYLMEEMLIKHNALYMGLGGSFDVYTGKKKRAPLIYQKLGLEWFHRLLLEPTRIRRQVVYLKFMLLLVLKRL